MQGYETGIKKARNALFVTAALVLVGEIIAAASAGVELSPLLVGIIVIEAGVFIGLAFWTKSKPYTAIITGLILFILMWVAAIVLNDAGGQSIYRGIIVKGLIIYFLASAVKPVKTWEEAKKRV